MTSNITITEEMIRAGMGWREMDENENITDPTASMVERILSAGLRAMHADAPKVEQEPWDYAVRYRDYGWGLASDLPADERELVLRGIPFWEVKPLYTHSAPVSDARVISYEDAHATATEMGYPSLTEALEDLERLQKDRDAFDGLGDSAPASDELLEAAEEMLERLLGAWPTLASTLPVSRLQSAIAKHKGPQS